MTSRLLSFVLVLVALGGCSVSGLDGKCSSDAQCAAGSRCDQSQSPAVCVVPQGACFPACASGFTCVSGACIPSDCRPPCGSSQACDPQTVTCKDVTAPTADVTSPGASNYVGVNVQATATARAPGGVNSVRFEVRTPAGSVLNSATVTSPTPANTANFAATVVLNNPAVTDGDANLVAVVSYPAGLKESAPLPVKIDLTPPTVSMGAFDGRASWFGPSTPAAAVTALVTDSGSGVNPADVKLTLLGGAKKTYAGAAAGSNLVSFSIPLADLGVADGQQGSVSFRVDATDKVGNAAPGLSGLPTQVVQVDRVAPAMAITADSTWYAANGTVTVNGSGSDAQSGLAAGSVTLTATSPAPFSQTGTINGATWSATVALASLPFPATEGPWPFTINLTDSVGNVATASGSVQVDNKPPVIGTPVLSPDYTDGSGRLWFRGTGPDVSINVAIADGSKVDTASVCLVVGAACRPPVSSTVDATNSGTYTFALPRQATDGPVSFSVAAKDQFGHAATSATQTVWFDATGPVVSIANDGAWYSRGTGSIAVRASISDASSGLASAAPTMTVAGAPSPVPGTFVSGTTWQFALDTTLAAAGAEGPLAFTIKATDQVGNATVASGSRNVDDKPPAITITQVYKAGATAGAQQVTYPAAQSGTGYSTGHDGSHFILRDAVTVVGTIQDGAGIQVTGTPPQFQVNGAGGTPAGPLVAISSCTDGQTSCSFSFTTTLNDPTRAAALAGATGTLQLKVSATDKAVSAGAGTGPHSGSGVPVDLAVTRFWWSQVATGASSVSGLAIHPDGDVIVTTVASAGTDTLHAFYGDGPLNASGGAFRWHKGLNLFGAGLNLDSIEGAPAIGGGASPNIYVGTLNRHIASISPSGALDWNCANLGVFHRTPAIAPASNLNSVPGSCEAVFAAGDSRQIYASCPDASKICNFTSVLLSDVGTTSALVQGGKIYVGENLNVARTELDAKLGTLTLPVQYPSSGSTANTITSLTFGNSRFFASVPGGATSQMYEFNAAMGTDWVTNPASLVKMVAGQPVLEPAGAGLVLLTNDNKVHSLVEGTGADGTLQTLSDAGLGMLLGANGTSRVMYIVTAAGSLKAVADATGYAEQWSLLPPGAGAATSAPSPTMACDGTVYYALADTVYAVVTDSRGLANTPWPKYQRDTRNSGNADAATPWGVNVGGTCTQ